MTKSAAEIYLYLAFEDARRHGNNQQARSMLDQLLTLTPSETVYLAAANFEWGEGNIVKSREILKKAETLYPASRDVAVNLANTYYAEKRHDDAVLTLRAYHRRNPDTWRPFQDIALIYLDAGKHAEALDALEQIADEHLKADILYYKAKASAGLGLNRQARELLEKAVAMDPGFVEAWAELAYIDEVSGDLLAAEKVYQRLLSLGETGQEVWLRLLSLNLRLNNPDKALNLYHQAPSGISFSLEAATLFLDEKFYDHARAILVPLTEQPETPDRLWFYMAVLAYEGDRDADLALSYLNRIPESAQHYQRAARFRIHMLFETGQQEKAMHLIREQQDDNPSASEFWLLEASMLRQRGNFDGARKVLEQAISQWPKNTELLYGLGIVFEKLGKTTKAVETMEKIIQIDPEHADALNYVGYTLADNNTDLARAELLISKALEISPDSGFIIDSWAWLLFRKGDLEQAWIEIKKAVEHIADDPTVWEHYGDIARESGRIGKAREGYSNSLELKPENTSAKEKLESL